MSNRQLILIALIVLSGFATASYFIGYRSGHEDYPQSFRETLVYLRGNYEVYKEKEDSMSQIIDSLSKSAGKPASSFYTKNGDHITIDLNTGSITIKNKNGGTSSINTGSGNMYINNSSASAVQVGDNNSISYEDDDN